MTEASRVPCCIEGCRRTFRADKHPGCAEVMCGRHFRAHPNLLRMMRLTRRAERSHEAARRRAVRKGVIEKVQQCERILGVLYARDERLWRNIKTNAQAMQDAGCWAPRPRTRRSAPKRKEALHDPFEREFQRLKRTQAHG